MKILPHERGDAYWRRVALEEKEMNGSTYRTRRMNGMSAMEAALTPVKSIASSVRDPDSAAQVAKRHDIHPNAIWEFKRKNPDTELGYEEIAEIVAERKKAQEERAAFNDRCRAKGLVPRTIRGWMKRYGLTEEQAINRGLKK